MIQEEISGKLQITAFQLRITYFIQVSLVMLIANFCWQPIAMADKGLNIKLQKSLLFSRESSLISLEPIEKISYQLDSLPFTDLFREGIDYQFADRKSWHDLALIIQIEEDSKANLPKASVQAQDLLFPISDQTQSTRVTSPESPLEKNVKIPINTIQTAQANEKEAASNNYEDLAKQSQNPIASLISVPLQNNTNFGVGELDRTSNILNIQPVIPTPINDNWNLVNRTIIPIAYQPKLTSGSDDAFGFGDINYQGFFTPRTTGDFTWGVGPSLIIPTATDTVLGLGKWSLGASAVGLVTKDRIVAGGLISQVWSFAGDDDRSEVSLLTLQPFFNYNFEGGWYAVSAPILTANWNAEGEQWVIPIGGGFGRVFNIGKQPVNTSLQGYWNIVHPDNAADWTVRAQLTLLFPK
ncbi:MAG: hypothetical protein RI580_09065 [Halothece sp. Uz-M2-17]|nr:hypothetical protein [Halothece sp. Uz-M2-17]